jgi:hypothetical protein
MTHKNSGTIHFKWNVQAVPIPKYLFRPYSMVLASSGNGNMAEVDNSNIQGFYGFVISSSTHTTVHSNEAPADCRMLHYG